MGTLGGYFASLVAGLHDLDGERRRFAQVVLSAYGLSLATWSGLILRLLIAPLPPIVTGLAAVHAIGYLLVPVLLHRRSSTHQRSLAALQRSTQVGGRLLTAIFFSLLATTAMTAGGLATPVLVIAPLLPIFATFLLGIRAGRWTTLATIALLSGLAWINPAEWLPLPTEHDAALARGAFLVITAVLATVFAELYEREALAREQRIRSGEALYRRLVEQSKDAVTITNPAGQLLDINPAGVELFGFSSHAEALSADVRTFYRDPDERRELLAALQANGYVSNYEARQQRQDGSPIVVRGTTSVLRNADGQIEKLLTILRDVTHEKRHLEERMQLQQELQEQQKLEAVGRLAGGVAHDFNNLLMVISASLDAAEIRGAPGSSQPLLDDAHGAIGRASALVGRLLAYGRQQMLQRQRINLAEAVDAELEVLWQMVGEAIVVEHDSSSEAWAFADPNAVEQILMNLVANARDAMPEGGTIRIETAAAEIDAGFCDLHPWARPGTYARLVVRDSGVGMDEETLSNACEPFFTTRVPGAATGLGLASVNGIVQQHGGFLHLDSRPHEGTTVEIFLPAP